MLMFEPLCKRDRVEGQILDLDMTMKDGILDGGVYSRDVGNGIGEKLNLAKMIEELNLYEVSDDIIYV